MAGLLAFHPHPLLYVSQAVAARAPLVLVIAIFVPLDHFYGSPGAVL
jgi:hypothetical protein